MGFNISNTGAGNTVTLTAPSGTLSVDTTSQIMAVNPNGILTRPQTPYFRGQMTVGSPNPWNATGHLPIVADQNIGNCWNNGTYQFTCPLQGYYLCAGGAIAQNQAGYLYLTKNGSTIHFTHWNHMGAWHFVLLSGIAWCMPNDTLWWNIGGQTPATTGLYSAAGHQMWSIALLA